MDITQHHRDISDKVIHNKHIGRRIRTVLLGVVVSGLLSGCALFPEVDVTEEQSKLIAEYAAGLLLKYESGHQIGLEKISDEPLEEAPVEETAEALTEENSTIPEEPSDTEESLAAQEQAADAPEAIQAGSAVPLAEAMGLSGFDVTYENYEICDIYPETESEDMFFSMQAAPGKELMIVHFNLTNQSDSEQLCDMVDSDVMFRLVVNGNERINEQMTILLNDLKQYQDSVAGFGMADTVLVFEIEEGAQDSFESLQLLVKDNDVENLYPLM